MRPNRKQAMLTLRPDWRQYTVGSNAVDLAEQVPPGSLRVEFWRHALRAALDRMVARCAKRQNMHYAVTESPRLTWRINQVRYVFLPELGYECLEECADLGELAVAVTILTPPRRDFLAQKVLSALLGKQGPSVWAVDTYLDFRALMDQADFGEARNIAFINLLRGYNQRVAETSTSASIMVDIPVE